ncbi:G2/mitotic-specific cyclin cdc13 [Hypsizygus marmoreus]|uniref:G2/mitotic-specific cyclin cdc13 n=1 Tax=Hypsizygus marmoreus TaxID=39966 RepID=A0A369K6Y9_HYPMA|nr:G2/mitotic-specific cyclin cdc13 [Hypsizygus marmoreus]
MSSNIPTRRITRTTRTTTAKDNENANARPSRITTRAKPAALTAATTATGGTSRATAGTAASRAKMNDTKADAPAGKRKREALGEVTSLVTNNKPGGKGKDKEDIKKEKFDGVVIKSKVITTRQPLRTVAGTRQTTRTTTTTVQNRTLEEVKEETEVIKVPDENAMVIDPPAPALPSITVRRSMVSKETAAASVRHSTVHAHRRTSARSTIVQRQVVEEVEASRVFKKRRTSSDAPQEDPAAIEEARLLAEEEEAAARLAAEIEAYAEEPEADSEGSQWEDLDADDVDDPLMVSEYVVEIFNYLKQVEATTMPNPNYMESQKELAWKMRGILTDWLIQVHVRFRLLPETLFLCVNIIDRFLSARVVSLAKLQLVGVTCMFIAAKFEEVVAPSVSHFLMCADASYTESEILQAERYVLKTLDWNMSYPNPVHYLRRISKADEYNVRVRTLAKYLLEIQCLEWRLIAAPPSLMAAAAIWLARLALGMENWTPNLAHYSSYCESALVPTANLMLNYILKPIRHDSFHKKYAGKRYFKSSVYMRDWALTRWEEGTQVNLYKELPRLKAEIRLERQAEELRMQHEGESQAEHLEV